MDRLLTIILLVVYKIKEINVNVLLLADKIIYLTEGYDKEGDVMDLRGFCYKKGYIWSPEVERQYQFLLRSARIKNIESQEIDEIIYKLLRTNKYILTRRKSERLSATIKSVEIVMKTQIPRRKG
ncbi:hypothetical protein GCM10007425_29380 [Lysinibacillus alkalisoli]|uniref:Uncharacterized protein n=1 Tax=Lysinibacillus alkalisoli TaxID=1911548 RepID=A0A917G9W8_9BACI|nr:hypothetical protein [Lysinibacillus alkalisoli]GGG32848.1 hypothetical protein GCM10007425_29380 [Lysinibacillus alkalisoli]